MVASTAKKNGRSGGLNKSQAIRDFVALHPTYSARQVADALNKLHPEGGFTSQLVYGARHAERTSKAASKPRKKPQPSPGMGLVPVPAVEEIEVPEQVEESKDVVSRLTPDNFVALLSHDLSEKEVRAAAILLYVAYNRVSQENAVLTASAANCKIVAKSSFQIASNMVDAL